ncbi:rifamycin-inactivating phosphotransferase [Actinosynnema sp. NPDC053489]|uniref:rifamycin-inactivating phosphotransferase n=1 Tax=Actinosynnema sp. NPDC053489 TaxID=3363916 RepID=UPI0037C6BD73
MGRYVLDFQDVDRTRVAAVGGKGAHLGELSRVEGIRVPAGFCVTTEAFRRVVGDAPSIAEPLDRLARLTPGDREGIRERSEEVRRAVEGIAIPDDVAEAVTGALDDDVPYAVRSSATAEDLPGASFAGQQDSYLNVVGAREVLRHVSRCWASLFTERAVTYRLRNGFDHRGVHMAVVVQRMVFPHAAGVLFTADPVTSNRRVATVEATVGLGEALVSGLVNADSYQVRDDRVVARAIAAKELAVHALPGGGTGERATDPERRDRPALTDEQVVRLVRLGRRVEAHFGRPQDIEWCLDDDGFQIVQSRPITTLFPVPEADDGENHVYLSVGHQQMMTDAMKPLGLSVWQLTTPRPMAEAGGRLFVDVTRQLASPTTRAGLLGVAGKSDPLMQDALRTVLDRDGFVPSLPDEAAAPPIPGAAPVAVEPDPALVAELIRLGEESVAAVKAEIRAKTGPELLDFILDDVQELRRLLFEPRSLQVIMAAMQATWWLNEHLLEWLGERNAADVLTQSVPHNVTSEMGLALLDVADAIRPFPEVVAFLRDVRDDDFLDRLVGLDGGREARDAITAYLDRYGMRCVGEIDITRPRWSERPTALLPVLLTNIADVEPGAGARRFERGRQEAAKAERDLLERLRALPDGERKAGETKRRIDLVRTFTGYREFPKYGMISRYFVYKRALLGEAARLVRAGVLREAEDVFFLRFQEFHEVVRANRVDDGLIARRKEAFRSYEALTPPRVITSDGETVNGAYRRDDLPAGALVGLPVSAGTVEGRARVILDMATADVEPGDILVTAHTDPSWSPLFVAVAGLVTEVGGLMTHGAVITREYGLPAVVGVERATRVIRDGQRIRVNGTDGYVEILS